VKSGCQTKILGKSEQVPEGYILQNKTVIENCEALKQEIDIQISRINNKIEY
jgi:hypothetical protein